MNENVAKVASDVISGLKASPALLALVALNAVGIGAGVWFMNALANAQAKRFDMTIQLINTLCKGGLK